MSTLKKEQIETMMRQASEAIALARQGLDKLRAALDAATSGERTVQLADGLDMIRRSGLPGIELPDDKVIDDLLVERSTLVPPPDETAEPSIDEPTTRG